MLSGGANVRRISFAPPTRGLLCGPSRGVDEASYLTLRYATLPGLTIMLLLWLIWALSRIFE